jgi:hypothetical protein
MNENQHDDDPTREYAEKGSGGELFGPASPTTHYHCHTHGELLAREILWDRAGQPHCPQCGGSVTPII